MLVFFKKKSWWKVNSVVRNTCCSHSVNGTIIGTILCPVCFTKIIAISKMKSTTSVTCTELLKKRDLLNRKQKQPPERYSIENAVFKNLALVTGKILCWSLFFNKDVGLHAYKCMKKRLQCRCFQEKFVKFLKTPVLKNISEWLILRKVNENVINV